MSTGLLQSTSFTPPLLTKQGLVALQIGAQALAVITIVIVNI
jgi:hypothetical protein